MLLTYILNGSSTANGSPRAVEVPETGDLPEAIEQIHANLIEACNGAIPRQYLPALIASTLLQALEEDADVALGELLAFPDSDQASS